MMEALDWSTKDEDETDAPLNPTLVLPALDLGTEGMRVGGQRTLRVPAKYAYGDKGYGEIPPGATTTLDIELLSVKVNPLTRQRTGS